MARGFEVRLDVLIMHTTWSLTLREARPHKASWTRSDPDCGVHMLTDNWLRPYYLLLGIVRECRLPTGRYPFLVFRYE